MFVYEELLLKDHDVIYILICKIEIVDLIGWEGVWGMLFSGFFLCITTFLPSKIKLFNKIIQ